MKKRLLVACSFFVTTVQAEDYNCTYQWEGKEEPHLMMLRIRGDTGVVQGSFLDSKFKVLSNNSQELILIEMQTEARAAENYPSGATMIVLDKVTNKLVRSNTFMNTSFNGFAYGKCDTVRAAVKKP